VHKSGKRAGERDALYLRLYVAGGVAAALIVLLVVGAVVVLNNPQLRGIVFAPTPTFSPTPVPPTMTYTPTPGFTPTPSPTPELTLTPSPTVPPEIPNAAVLAPQPTEIYPPIIDRSLRGAVGLLDGGLYDAALPTLEVEVTRAANAFDPNPYYYRALALARTGELDAAAGLLQAAARRLSERPNENFEPFISSGFAYVDLLRAKAAQKAGRRDEVQTLLRNVEDRAETVIERDPRLELAYLTLAERYSLERNYEEAIAVLDRGLSVPQLAANVRLIVAKGEAYFQQQEYDLAAYQAFLALYINPTTEAAHLLQIKTSKAQGKPGLAVLHAQSYLFYYPGSVEGYRLLGDARVAEGNLDLALEAYDQALAGGEDKPEVATILMARATLYMQQRRYEQARDDLTKAFTLSSDPAVRALRMQAAYQAGNFSTAENDVEALLGQGVIPDSQIRLLQARILLDQARSGDTADSQQALTLLDDVSSDLPGELLPIADEYRARALYNLGNYVQGLDAVNRALAAADTGSRHYLRGLILEANGETERARREYDWVLTWSTVYPYSFLPEVRARLEGLSAES
jgi:tetratricopeptide (TPR) repeat protein